MQAGQGKVQVSGNLGGLRRSLSGAPVPLWRRVAVEFLGSAFLAAVVIGSGIAARRLSPGETGLELLENAAATAAGLFAIILMFGPVSRPLQPGGVLRRRRLRRLRRRDATAYLPAQMAGRVGGAVVANLMFALPTVSISTKDRATPAHFLSEIVATLGPIQVIFALARSGRSRGLNFSRPPSLASVRSTTSSSVWLLICGRLLLLFRRAARTPGPPGWAGGGGCRAR